MNVDDENRNIIRSISHGTLDFILKAYNEFRIPILTVLIIMLYMTSEVMHDILKMEPDKISVEVVGVVGSFIAGVLATVKMFITDRTSDLEDRREHEQAIEMMKLKAKLGQLNETSNESNSNP